MKYSSFLRLEQELKIPMQLLPMPLLRLPHFLVVSILLLPAATLFASSPPAHEALPGTWTGSFTIGSVEFHASTYPS